LRKIFHNNRNVKRRARHIYNCVINVSGTDTHICKSNNLLLSHNNYGIHIKWYASVREHLISLYMFRTHTLNMYGNLLTADRVKFSVKHYMPKWKWMNYIHKQFAGNKICILSAFLSLFLSTSLSRQTYHVSRFIKNEID